MEAQCAEGDSDKGRQSAADGVTCQDCGVTGTASVGALSCGQEDIEGCAAGSAGIQLGLGHSSLDGGVAGAQIQLLI